MAKIGVSGHFLMFESFIISSFIYHKNQFSAHKNLDSYDLSDIAQFDYFLTPDPSSP